MLSWRTALQDGQLRVLLLPTFLGVGRAVREVVLQGVCVAVRSRHRPFGRVVVEVHAARENDGCYADGHFKEYKEHWEER